ncbi:MAG: hypothetical protein ABW099_05460 [Candidatus Binatia bacterium]
MSDDVPIVVATRSGATPLKVPLPFARGKMGFREFGNYDALGIIFPANTVTTLRLISWTKARRHG